MSLPVEPVYGVQHLPAALRVQHGGGLVKNKDIRLQSQNPGNGNALLLPAGQELGRTLFKAAHAYALQSAAHFFRNILFRRAEVSQPKGDILLHQRGDELIVRVLKYHAAGPADLPQVGASLRVQPRHGQFSALHRDQRLQMAGKSGLAAAVAAQQGNQLPPLYRKGDTVKRAALAARKGVGMNKFFSTYRVHGRRSFPSG